VHERLGYTPATWSVIPNGFDVETFRPRDAARPEIRRELGVESSAPLVGLLARFHPMKDHPTFLQAAAKVASTCPDVRFVAAGRGVDSSPALADLVARLGLRDRVFLLPERRDAPRFLASLDVAVSASYSEAFPNVVGEAMASGVPCVVTDVGDARLLVGETGSVVPPRDPLALADELKRLLNLDLASRQSLGLRSRRRIVDEFSLPRAAEKYQQLYEDLTACAE
jgi:glycosyltransferase involved in cell wall biosynthesis